MQQAARSAALVVGSKVEASSATSVPPLQKDICLGCEAGSQYTSRFPWGLCLPLLCFGSSGGAASCPLGTCSRGTGAMETIKNGSKWIMGICCTKVGASFPSVLQKGPFPLPSEITAALLSFLLKVTPYPLFFPCFPEPILFLEMLAPSFAVCQHIACLHIFL